MAVFTALYKYMQWAFLKGFLNRKPFGISISYFQFYLLHDSDFLFLVNKAKLEDHFSNKKRWFLTICHNFIALLSQHNLHKFWNLELLFLISYFESAGFFLKYIWINMSFWGIFQISWIEYWSKSINKTCVFSMSKCDDMIYMKGFLTKSISHVW